MQIHPLSCLRGIITESHRYGSNKNLIHCMLSIVIRVIFLFPNKDIAARCVFDKMEMDVCYE